MIHILTVQELLLVTDWLPYPDDPESVGLSELMDWDPRMLNEFSDEELRKFNSQWIAIPERVGRKLKITASPSFTYVDRITRLLRNGHTIHRAELAHTVRVNNKDAFGEDNALTCDDLNNE